MGIDTTNQSGAQTGIDMTDQLLKKYEPFDISGLGKNIAIWAPRDAASVLAQRIAAFIKSISPGAVITSVDRLLPGTGMDYIEGGFNLFWVSPEDDQWFTETAYPYECIIYLDGLPLPGPGSLPDGCSFKSVSPQEVEKHTRSQEALSRTDWYVIRELERMFLSGSEASVERDALRHSASDELAPKYYLGPSGVEIRKDYELEELPLPCTLTIEGIEYECTEQPVLEFNYPGTYEIHVNAGAQYLEKTFTYDYQP